MSAVEALQQKIVQAIIDTHYDTDWWMLNKLIDNELPSQPGHRPVWVTQMLCAEWEKRYTDLPPLPDEPVGVRF